MGCARLTCTGPQIHSCMLDVARGMEYLVHKGIVHCDLKDQNVLLFPGTTDDIFLSKICDFGFASVCLVPPPIACRLSRDQIANIERGMVGTQRYMAPEVIRKSSPPTEKSDVYSYGVLVWRTVTRAMPYGGVCFDVHDVRYVDAATDREDFAVILAVANEENLRPTIPAFVGAAWARLMRLCWDARPQARAIAQLHDVVIAPRTDRRSRRFCSTSRVWSWSWMRTFSSSRCSLCARFDAHALQMFGFMFHRRHRCRLKPSKNWGLLHVCVGHQCNAIAMTSRGLVRHGRALAQSSSCSQRSLKLWRIDGQLLELALCG